MSEKPSNPVLRVVNGIEIRKNNYLTITLNELAYQALVEESQTTNLSMAKLVAIKSQPCQECGCSNVTITVKKDGRSNKQNTGYNLTARNAQRH